MQVTQSFVFSFRMLTEGLQTLSHIANWEQVAVIEKERTLRVRLVARNQ